MYLHKNLGDVDILASLNSVEQGAENLYQNAAPTWAGGSPLTTNQLQTIQAQAAQNITQAAGGNTVLANQEIQQMTSQTNAVAQQAYQAAVNQDTGAGGPPGAPSSIASKVLWIGLAAVGIFLIIEIS